MAPGILIVRIKMLDPVFEEQGGWATWTKLHFDDLLSLGPAKISSTAQFLNKVQDEPVPRATAEEHNTKKAEEAAFPFFNIIELGDLDVLTSKEYLDLSRAKILQNKREEGEEMIWDVVDARFAAYELVRSVNEGYIQSSDDAAAGAEGGENTRTLITAEISNPLEPYAAMQFFTNLSAKIQKSHLGAAKGKLYKLRNETLNPVPVLESSAWLGVWSVEGSVKRGWVEEELVGELGTEGKGVQVGWGFFGSGYRKGGGGVV